MMQGSVRKRTFLAHRFAVELGHDGTCGRNRSLDPFRQKADEALIDRDLPIGEQLHQHGAQQDVVRRAEANR